MFDLIGLREAVAAHGRVARIVIAAHDGSSPREVGASMLIWQADAGQVRQSGTIGGGALEHEATLRAQAALAIGGRQVQRVALGPALGQCCGGAVTVWTEVYDADSLPEPVAGVVARGPGERPIAVSRLLAAARGQGQVPGPGMVQGWMIEPVATPMRQIWIWGAGHVGRALVAVLAPLPGMAITWVDIAPDRFPGQVPDGVTAVPAADPAALVAHAPPTAEHVIVTYSHALDLDLCHRLLGHGFGACGLIGSKTKWARFRSRLTALGHSPQAIARIDCPIGDPSFGKHPQAIAVGVAARILRQGAAARGEKRA
ncbi:MAG: xanthine dehydrogenase accessory protein XdhC [Paracoccaceae bacterium]